MGQRGPAPEPVALKLLKGETRPSQLARVPDTQDPPVKPDDLKSNAAKVWDRVLTAIAVSSHIGPMHAESFRQYCEVTAAMNEMQPKGSKEWRELANIHRQLARELCLTPATSGGLVKAKPAERKLDKYVTRTG